MKSRFIKMAMVAASAIAFMNCSDDAANVVSNTIGDNEIPSVDQSGEPVVDSITGEVIQPVDPELQLPADGPSEGQPVVPPSDDVTVDPNVPGDENPVVVPGDNIPFDDSNPTDPSVDPASSSSVIPAISSSSEKVEQPESSSSVEEPVQQAPKGIFLSDDGDENRDQMQIERMEHTGPDGGAILAWPKQLSSDPNVKHAVVVWGPGGGTEPGAYGGMINRLASHGFVVIALSSSPGDASKAIAALDWLEEKSKDPNGPLYNKLDFTKVGCSGHSMGGLESEQALIKDKRVITAIMNNSGDLGHTAMGYVPSNKTIAIVYGEKGMERPNAEADYNYDAVKAPACLIQMTGGPMNDEGGWGHGSGAWDGVSATVAWMRWHLGGETNRKVDFVGSSGKYIDGPIYVSYGTQGNWKGQCKNF